MPSSVSQTVLDVAPAPAPRKRAATPADTAFSDILTKAKDEMPPPEKAPAKSARRTDTPEPREPEPTRQDPARAAEDQPVTDETAAPTDATTPETAEDTAPADDVQSTDQVAATADATQTALALALAATATTPTPPTQPAGQATGEAADAVGDAATAAAVAAPLIAAVAQETTATATTATEPAETAAKTDPSETIVEPKLPVPATETKAEEKPTATPGAKAEPEPLRADKPAEPGKGEAKPDAKAPEPQAAVVDGLKPEPAKAEVPKPEPVRADPATPVPTAATADTSRLAGPSAAQTTIQTQSPAVTIPQVAATIVAHAKAGESRFQIRLDPPDLGRIDVSLSVDQSGTASTVLTVERMDTLDLLQRDSRALERALNTAGFKTDQDSLQFTYRDPGQQSSSGQQQAFGDGRGRSFTVIAPELGVDAAIAPLQTLAAYGPGRFRLGGLDIKV